MVEELNIRWHRLSDRQKQEALEHIEETTVLEGLLRSEVALMEKIAAWLASNSASCYHLATSDRKLVLRRA